MVIRNADSRATSRRVDGQRPPGREIDDVILDAARSCVLDFGMRRTTLAEISRRAGVSRPTVYRRWADTRAVVADLLTREIRAVLPELALDGPVCTQLVAAVGDAVGEIRDHPLFAKIRQTDQELLTTYMVDRLGASQKTILTLITDAVAAGQRDGSVRSGEPGEMAAMVLLMAQSVVFSAPTFEAGLSAGASVAQLRYAVRAYLTPAAESGE